LISYVIMLSSSGPPDPDVYGVETPESTAPPKTKAGRRPAVVENRKAGNEVVRERETSHW
jgi:hypothetical protein